MKPKTSDEASALDVVEGAALAGLAVAAVAAGLTGRSVADHPPAAVARCGPGASFVTLERAGRLRGCVGSLDASRLLWRDVIRNATRAMADPRLPPVSVDDWPWLDVTVSVLSAPEPVPAEVAADLAAVVGVLRPGTDGVLITDGQRRATFLPAVWRKEPDPVRFLTALLAKGGWPAGRWPAGLSVRRYTATEFHDLSPRAPLQRTVG